MSDNLRAAIYMNIAMLAFTLNDTCMKAVTQSMPLFQAITLRGVISAGALIAMAIASGAIRHLPDRAGWRALSLRSVAEVGGTVFFLGALMHMPLANLSAIMQSMPLAVTLAAALVFGDRVSLPQILAIGLGLLGVLMIIRPGHDGFGIWSVMGLASVACVVVRDIATRSMPLSLPSLTVSVAAAVSVLLLGLVGMAITGWTPVDLREALLILGAGSNLVVGYIFVVKMMRIGSIAVIAPMRYMALLWAILLGWLVFGSFPDAWTLTGSAIVVATGLFTLYHGTRRPAGAPQN